MIKIEISKKDAKLLLDGCVSYSFQHIVRKALTESNRADFEKRRKTMDAKGTQNGPPKEMNLE
jgi:hypothetical protein